MNALSEKQKSIAKKLSAVLDELARREARPTVPPASGVFAKEEEPTSPNFAALRKVLQALARRDRITADTLLATLGPPKSSPPPTGDSDVSLPPEYIEAELEVQVAHTLFDEATRKHRQVLQDMYAQYGGVTFAHPDGRRFLLIQRSGKKGRGIITFLQPRK